MDITQTLYITRRKDWHDWLKKNHKTEKEILGAEEKQFWKDHKSAKINVLRTKTMIQKADIVIIRFGEKYKQWNVAFDAGICTALNKPYITLHSEELIHPLKEVDAASLAWATSTSQIVEILEYTTRK